MTHRDVARGRDTVARWCNLAERRLDYLTELFETGRWRRFHSEVEFLENIREAKAAVETWRDLLKREDSPDKSAISMFLLRASRTTLPRDEGLRAPGPKFQPPPAPIVVDPPPSIPADILVALENQLAASDDAPSVSDAPAPDEIALPVLDLDVIQQRYPLLRNTL